VATAVLRVDEPLPDGSGFPISLTAHEADGAARTLATGVIDAALATPSPPIELEPGESTCEAIRRLIVASPQPPGEHVRSLATWLHAVLDDAGVGAELRRLRGGVPDGAGPGEGLRLYLDIRPRDVRRLPWELMSDQAGWAFGDTASPVARIHADFGRADPKRDWFWPIRVLVVVGSAEDDEDARVEREVGRLQNTLARDGAEVDVEVVRRPTDRGLAQALWRIRPHVLHVIGRGERSRTGDARLVFELEERHRPLRRWFWRAGTIRGNVPEAPRVVVLHCCRSDRTAHQQATWQVAEAFAASGVPAVVSMQGPIDARDAVAFNRSFYSALTAGLPFDAAVTAGRRAIARPQTVPEQREVCFPTLILNQPPDTIVPPRWLPGPEIQDRVRALESDNRPTLLDRRVYRRKLLEQLDRTNGEGDRDFAAPPPRLIAISGPEAIGKSALARWVIARQVQRGRQAAYVRLEVGGRREGWLDVLRKVSDAVAEAAIDSTAFDTFGRQLGALRERAAERARAAGRWDEASALTDEELDAISDGFVRALRATAERGTLIIAVDPLDIGDDAPTAPVIPRVVSRIDAGDAGDTRLLLVKRGAAGDLPAARVVPYTLWIDDFDTQPSEVESLWREFLVTSYDDDDRVESMLPLVVALPLGTGSPVAILDLFRAIKRVGEGASS
jgi:hypothetical protein